MREATLWDHLRPALERRGKFQKISDRFTPGIPDVLGCSGGRGFAWEFKELDGVRILKLKFRPGQLDWLRDWEQLGQGTSWVVSTHGQTVYVHHWSFGEDLEKGCSPQEVIESASIVWTKTRHNLWGDFVDLLLQLD